MPGHADFYPSADDEEPIDIADERWQPEKMALDDELVRHIERGIATMSDKLKGVLLLHDREDMAYEEIAETLRIPVGTVKSRLFLARAHLQSVLADYLRKEAAPL